MRLTLYSTKQEAEGVVTFSFNAEEPISWIAGQSIKIELPVSGFDTEERRFTISAAPYEKDVSITTRITTSLFKKSLLKLKTGDTVEARAIEGAFTWKQNEKPHIFIAGGIGVTPFYAMLKQRLQENLPIHTQLVYLGQRNRLPFLQQLALWHEMYDEFQLLHISQRADLRDIVFLPGSYIYISGPTAMVAAFQDLLEDNLNIPPHLIKTDQFTGYREEGETI